ncbi:hypothetical protein BH11BAC1_BH11BAC1_20010 [soil metagenome]
MFSYGQGRGDVWCFGLSAQMKFSGGNLQANGSSSLFAQEECTSISDQAGNLLFYVGPNYFHSNGWFPQELTIWDRNNQIMQNGDSLCGITSATSSTLILPLPNDTSLCKLPIFSDHLKVKFFADDIEILKTCLSSQ